VNPLGKVFGLVRLKMADEMPAYAGIWQFLSFLQHLLHVILANIDNSRLHNLTYCCCGECFCHSEEHYTRRIPPRPETRECNSLAYVLDILVNHSKPKA